MCGLTRVLAGNQQRVTVGTVGSRWKSDLLSATDFYMEKCFRVRRIVHIWHAHVQTYVCLEAPQSSRRPAS